LANLRVGGVDFLSWRCVTCGTVIEVAVCITLGGFRAVARWLCGVIDEHNGRGTVLGLLAEGNEKSPFFSAKALG